MAGYLEVDVKFRKIDALGGTTLLVFIILMEIRLKFVFQVGPNSLAVCHPKKTGFSMAGFLLGEVAGRVTQ